MEGPHRGGARTVGLMRISREGVPGQTWSYTGSNLLWQVDRQDVTNAAGSTQAHASPVRSSEFDGNLESLTKGFLPQQLRIAWLPFCSGPFLSRTNREVPLPSTIWKQTWLYFDHAADPAGFRDQTVRFDDEFGLPISIDVVTKSGQPVFQHRLKHHQGPSPLSTNVSRVAIPARV